MSFNSPIDVSLVSQLQIAVSDAQRLIDDLNYWLNQQVAAGKILENSDDPKSPPLSPDKVWQINIHSLTRYGPEAGTFLDRFNGLIKQINSLATRLRAQAETAKSKSKVLFGVIVGKTDTWLVRQGEGWGVGQLANVFEITDTMMQIMQWDDENPPPLTIGDQLYDYLGPNWKIYLTSGVVGISLIAWFVWKHPMKGRTQ